MILALMLTLALLPGTAAAQLLRPRVEIAPYAGVLLPGDLDGLELDDSVLFGARAGVRLPGGLGVEAQVGYAPLEGSLPGPEGNRRLEVGTWIYEGGLSYSLPLPGPITPFVGASAGQASFDPDLVEDGDLDSESSFALSAGAGVRLSLPGLGLRVDVRDHFIFDALDETRQAVLGRGGETLSAIEASAGLSFLL